MSSMREAFTRFYTACWNRCWNKTEWQGAAKEFHRTKQNVSWAGNPRDHPAKALHFTNAKPKGCWVKGLGVPSASTGQRCIHKLKSASVNWVWKIIGIFRRRIEKWVSFSCYFFIFPPSLRNSYELVLLALFQGGPSYVCVYIYIYFFFFLIQQTLLQTSRRVPVQHRIRQVCGNQAAQGWQGSVHLPEKNWGFPQYLGKFLLL